MVPVPAVPLNIGTLSSSSSFLLFFLPRSILSSTVFVSFDSFDISNVMSVRTPTVCFSPESPDDEELSLLLLFDSEISGGILKIQSQLIRRFTHLVIP